MKSPWLRRADWLSPFSFAVSPDPLESQAACIFLDSRYFFLCIFLLVVFSFPVDPDRAGVQRPGPEQGAECAHARPPGVQCPAVDPTLHGADLEGIVESYGKPFYRQTLKRFAEQRARCCI